MADLLWLVSLAAGAICFGAGMLGWMKSPRSPAAALFLLGMTCTFVAMITGPLYPMVSAEHSEVASMLVKAFATSGVLAVTFLWTLALVFPVERKISWWPVNYVAVAIVLSLALAVAVGLAAEVDYSGPDAPTMTRSTGALLVVAFAGAIVFATGTSLYSMTQASPEGRRSGKIYLVGIWIFAASGSLYAYAVARPDGGDGIGDLPNIMLVLGVLVAGIVFASSIARGQMSMSVAPREERLASAAKSQFKLLQRRVYLVEEPKPGFSMKIFTDILKGRCWDCEEDDSFACESLDCSACSLPCPCRKCTKYGSRTQGLVVTRQFPKDIRAKYYLQTTPIIWLTTVAGKDNIDPAKLSVLTDFLVNFMEKSANGVVLVDGIEYLVTSNDFPRVLRAIDRWTETAMGTKTRLIISIDPRAYSPTELAMIERSREVVRPEAEPWLMIPEPM